MKVHDSYNNRHNVFVGGIEGEKTSAAVSNGIYFVAATNIPSHALYKMGIAPMKVKCVAEYQQQQQQNMFALATNDKQLSAQIAHSCARESGP